MRRALAAALAALGAMAALEPPGAGVALLPLIRFRVYGLGLELTPFVSNVGASILVYRVFGV